jgi:hypothetical protein
MVPKIFWVPYQGTRVDGLIQRGLLRFEISKVSALRNLRPDLNPDG